MWEAGVTTAYDYKELLQFAQKLGACAGLSSDMSTVQAAVLLEADLMGHSTHGLNLLPGFLKDIEGGAIKTSGTPASVSDKGSTFVWDGDSLLGTWLMMHAIEEAQKRIREHPVVTAVIKRSGHIAALGAYLRKATDAGLVMLLMTTNPLMRTVVPAGGVDPILAPNPIAFGYPTEGEPILIDISTSAVANGWVRRWATEKKRLPEKWLQDSKGQLTDDPSALFGPPPGALLPLGGIELGHKGFALGLIVEALTGGLSGVGHTGEPKEAGNLVFFQLLDPNAFSGLSVFKKDSSLLANACRSSRSRNPVHKVRMPGDGANSLRREQLASGVRLYPSIMPALKTWANKLNVPVPSPLEK